MEWLRQLAQVLPDEVVRALGECTQRELSAARELRMHAGGVTLCMGEGLRSLCSMDADGLRAAVELLTRGNRHALGECVRQGFVPLPGGFRAGLCGRALVRGGEVAGLEEISSVCIRISRPVCGAADVLLDHVMDGQRVRSLLVLSAPGLGKTTLLRDLARSLSLRGRMVAVADERGELAGAGHDMGPNTDVLSLCPKAEALPMLVRAMRPDAIVTDELGAPGDAQAAADAARCGVAVIASAHAASRAQAAERPGLGELLRDGAFERMAEIRGPRPGQDIRVYDERGNRLC